MIELNESTVKQLRFLQRTNKDRRVFIKVTVLLMLHMGFSVQDIASSLGIDDATVYRYRQGYESQGLEGYLSSGFVAYQGLLNKAQQAELMNELRSHLYINSREIAHYIEHAFGIKYSCAAVVKLLKRLGFVYKKTKSIPSKVDVAAQEKFLCELQSLLAQKDKNRIIYFNDAVHPQHNTRSDYGWIYQGEDFEIPTNPGRKCLHLNGALNAEKVTDVLILEAERINAQACIELWEKQRLLHPTKTIYNICDNAPYYHSRVIKEWLRENTWCQVIYLPPYSPNLNLIERLWKFLRKQVTSYFFYQHFAQFREAVLNFFNNIKEHKQALKTLLTLNFRISGK